MSDEEVMKMAVEREQLRLCLDDFVREWDDTYDVDEPEPGRKVPNQPMDYGVYRRAKDLLERLKVKVKS